MFKEDRLEGVRVKNFMIGGLVLKWIESLKRGLEMRNFAQARVLSSQIFMSVVQVFCGLAFFAGFQSDSIASQEMTCGGRRISMICEEEYGLTNVSCGRPLLFFENGDLALVRRAADSGRHVDKVVRRAECLAAGRRSAVLIHFSNGPLDCGPCVILDLYSLDGKRITKFGRGLDAAISSRGLALPGKVFVEIK